MLEIQPRYKSELIDCVAELTQDVETFASDYEKVSNNYNESSLYCINYKPSQCPNCIVIFRLIQLILIRLNVMKCLPMKCNHHQGRVPSEGRCAETS